LAGRLAEHAEEAVAGSALQRTSEARPETDPRFARLLARADWARLPAPVRRRFSERLAATETALYAGEVVRT
jgi:hypothetical protein